MNWKAIVTGCVASVALSACTSAPKPQRPTPTTLTFSTVADSIIQFAMRETQWGVEVWDQARNSTVYSHNNYRHFIPASNTKLVVTTVAMGLLGPDWRYQTPVMITGTPGDSVPRSLVIRGSGDPTMSARYFGSNAAVLDAFADSLVQKGVRRIAGDVIIDASRFGRENIHSAWEIGDLPWYYATRTAAFAIGEAETRMIISSGATPASITANFDQSFSMPLVLRIRMDTAGASPNLDVDYQAWPDSLVVTGSMGPNRADTSRLALPDPEMFAARSLIEALKRKGIAVTGVARVERDSARVADFSAASTLFVWQSPPVSDVIAGILKPSQNWIAEQLLKTLGYVKGGGATWREGLRVERRYLIDVARIDSTAFYLSDGSGLSAQNVISPRAFVMLLEHARHAPWAAQYKAALPAPGMRGATLSSRLPGLETRLAAKTGTIANVNSLSGYLRAADGREITFSIMTNGSGRPSSEVRRAMDVLVQAIARETRWE